MHLSPRVTQAIELLSGREMFGLAWLDPALVAIETYGGLSGLITIGRPITETVLPLFGLDDVLLGLVSGNGQPFEMPNVSIATADGTAPRLNLHVSWLPERREYLVYVGRAQATGELEIGLAQQVRARMIVEAELAQKSRALTTANDELTRANRDLAEFAYVISHDLKAPLRAMRYYAEDLGQALEAAQAQTGGAREQAERIRFQCRRMTRMLNDLLAYSRIGRQEEALEPVDTGALVRSIVDSMPKPAGFSIEVSGDWPVLETYAAPLDLVLRNLIGNAIAHHDRRQGRIEVVCRAAEDSGIEITIADDGPGIPVEWQDAVFQPFKTIKQPSDESSGIGLALVRRAIEAHGARLTLTSDPDRARGSRFQITWPQTRRG